jgi:hypothetical protein
MKLMHRNKLDASAGEMGWRVYLRVFRGSTILNLLKSPGSVSTSILPPCCFTMMSWLIERPSPAPSPDGLVVKNGLNIFALTPSGRFEMNQSCRFDRKAALFPRA